MKSAKGRILYVWETWRSRALTQIAAVRRGFRPPHFGDFQGVREQGVHAILWDPCKTFARNTFGNTNPSKVCQLVPDSAIELH